MLRSSACFHFVTFPAVSRAHQKAHTHPRRAPGLGPDATEAPRHSRNQGVNTQKLSSRRLLTPSPDTPDLPITAHRPRAWMSQWLLCSTLGTVLAPSGARSCPWGSLGLLAVRRVEHGPPQPTSLPWTEGPHRFLLWDISKKADMNVLYQDPLRGVHSEGLNGQVMGTVDRFTASEAAGRFPTMAGPASAPPAVRPGPSCSSSPRPLASQSWQGCVRASH